MQIDRSVDPSKPDYRERLSIHASWQIQADDTPNGSVSILVRENKTETVYIIDKNSRMILDKFNRQ